MQYAGVDVSSNFDRGSYIISIAKTVSKKFHMKFLFPEVALYHYKSTIRPCIEYCSHIWTGAPSCYFEMLDNYKNGCVGLLVLHSLPLLNL